MHRMNQKSWSSPKFIFVFVLSLLFFTLGQSGSVSAYPLYAQQGYENPREATGRIVCANCHLAQKPVELEVPQAILPDTVFEAVIKIPTDQQVKQVTGTGKKGPLNVGAVLILPEGFRLAPTDRIPEEMQVRMNKLYVQPYSEEKQNILIYGPVPSKKYSEAYIPILSPKVSKDIHYLNYPIYLGGNRGRGQVYPNGKKSNNNVFTASTAGKIESITPGKEDTVVTIRTAAGVDVQETIPLGPSLIVSVGQNIVQDEPLTENPNVGGFGQEETSIILQSETRVQGLVLFFTGIVIAQVFLVVKKKQFEKVQLSEMNF